MDSITEMSTLTSNNDLSERLLSKKSLLDSVNSPTKRDKPKIPDSFFKIKTNTWYPEIENLLKIWGEKSGNLAKIHLEERKLWRTRSNFLSITSICVTVVSSSTSLLSANSLNHVFIMYAVGFLGLFATFLQSIKQFYKADERASKHKIYAQQFSSLYKSIKLQLSIKRDERTVPHDYIKWVYKTYDKLTNDAPHIKQCTIDKFNKEFKNCESAKPDVCYNDLVICINDSEDLITLTDTNNNIIQSNFVETNIADISSI